ncbi:MAG TPA: hypothetical protein GX000_07630 [Actinomyces sp.]|jgi:hypothetical protein|nr:hypothetical protein [Acidobacteriota bacterium]HHT41485.1 hypothetical protein [Actinomyces sp.]
MSTPIQPTPALRRAVSATIKNIFLVAVIIAVLTGIVAFIAGGAVSGLSAVIGGAIGLLLAAVTWLTMSMAMKSMDTQAAFMAGDYLFKLIVIVAAVLTVKNLTALDHKALGLALIISVVAQAVTQSWTLARAKVPTIDSFDEVKEH